MADITNLITTFTTNYQKYYTACSDYDEKKAILKNNPKLQQKFKNNYKHDIVVLSCTKRDLKRYINKKRFDDYKNLIDKYKALCNEKTK